MSVLHRRIASGFVYGLLSLFAVYLGGVPFLGAVLAMAFLAGHEYQLMIAHGGYRPLHALQFGLTAFLVLGSAWLAPDVILGGLGLILVSSLAWQLTRTARSELHYVDWALTIAGGLYLGWLPAYFVKLRSLPGGLWWMLLALAATWSCDSFAYVFGRALGRRSFFAQVSPRKTWEGALAGWLGATVVVVLVGFAALVYWYAQKGASNAPERRLRLICRGDTALAERLIEYEMQRRPGISRREAARRAIDSHRRDNA